MADSFTFLNALTQQVNLKVYTPHIPLNSDCF
jgi:hypothetical protein